jgi:branched-chain amino acid transport system substrate-binding protein
MKVKKIIGAITLALVGVAGVASVASAQSPLRFGALYPFSGGLALLGDESFRGFELAVEKRNAAGGLLGTKIEVFKSDAVDANQAVGSARRLISVDKVQAIFGSYASSISFAATQVSEKEGVPYFELGAISDPITERGYELLFRSNPTSKGFADRTVDVINQIIAPGLNVKPSDLRIAIIHEDALYGTTVAKYQIEGAKKAGLNIVEVLPYSAKAVDLSSLILRLKGSKVDVVLQTSYQNDTVLFFRQMKEADFKPKAVIGAGGGYSTQDTVTAVGADGMHGVFDIDFTQYLTNEAGAPGLGAFVKAYEAKYGTPPRSGHSLANYAGALIFFDAIQSAGSMDPQKIRKSVLALDIPMGQSATGWGAKFDASGQNTRGLPSVMQWLDGKLTTVFPPEAAVAKPVVGQVGK